MKHFVLTYSDAHILENTLKFFINYVFSLLLIYSPSTCLTPYFFSFSKSCSPASVYVKFKHDVDNSLIKLTCVAYTKQIHKHKVSFLYLSIVILETWLGTIFIPSPIFYYALQRLE